MKGLEIIDVLCVVTSALVQLIVIKLYSKSTRSFIWHICASFVRANYKFIMEASQIVNFTILRRTSVNSYTILIVQFVLST